MKKQATTVQLTVTVMHDDDVDVEETLKRNIERLRNHRVQGIAVRDMKVVEDLMPVNPVDAFTGLIEALFTR